MKPYINLDELKHDVQQQAENLPEYMADDHTLNKIDLQKAIELYYESKGLLSSMPPKELFKVLNNAIVDTLADGPDNKDDFEYSNQYIKDQVYSLTQISNFIACAIPD